MTDAQEADNVFRGAGATQAPAATSTEEAFNTARDKVEKVMRYIEKNLDIVGDVTIQEELSKVQSHLEYARMRLGVAMTYHAGFDPFSSKQGAKRRK